MIKIYKDNLSNKMGNQYHRRQFNSPIILMKKTCHVISPTNLQILLSYLKMHRVNLSLQIIHLPKSLEVVLVQSLQSLCFCVFVSVFAQLVSVKEEDKLLLRLIINMMVLLTKNNSFNQDLLMDSQINPSKQDLLMDCQISMVSHKQINSVNLYLHMGKINNLQTNTASLLPKMDKQITGKFSIEIKCDL